MASSIDPNLPSSSFSSFLSSLTPQPDGNVALSFSRSGLFGRLIHLWWADAGSHVRLNWTNLLFWTTCLTAMAGCGILSGLWARRRQPERPPVRRHYHKASSGTVTSSSEDEESEQRSSSSIRKKIADVSEREFATTYQRFSNSDKYVDPGLLKKHSSYVSYTTSVATYPSVRTFFRQHPQMDKFPSKPSPLPLLVFVHGLGGSLAQFHPLLTSLSNVGPCLGIDLPGCGLSSFSPKSWDAYTIEALAELLAVVIERHRDRAAGQGVVLIAHSLGCSLSALLASSTSPVKTELQQHILGLIAVCPKAAPPSPREVALFRRLLWIPNPIFNLWRLWDRRGGLKSKSVSRFVGNDADPDTRQLQVRFNAQSRSAVWRRMAWGSLPEYKDDKPVGGMPGQEVWMGLQTPVLLVAGEADAITKPAEIEKLLKYFGSTHGETRMDTDTGSSVVPNASRVHNQIPAPYDPRAHEAEFGVEAADGEAVLPRDSDESDEKQTNNTGSVNPRRVVKTTILPAPASHALLYDRATYRTLAGLIQDFLFKHVDHRLNLGWQLQHLNTSGKWDVKNLAKWKKVAPTSEPIADTFVALKMLREVDEEHNPVLFSQRWKDKIYAVVDISHENPVYDPNQLEKGGIHYHKHPTVSKIPPTPDETRDFIGLVDRLEREITDKMEKEKQQGEGEGEGECTRPLVGVHCHYGFNRTGFLIVSYLIERKGFSVQGAIDEFEKCRPPGIRHEHFIDTLFVRYCVGLKRAPTL